MRFTVLWLWLLAGAVLFFVGVLFLKKKRRVRLFEFAEPAQPKELRPTAHRVLLARQNALPPGFDLRYDAGLYPLSQVVAAAFCALPSSPGLYSVTFSSKTLDDLRSGHAHLMHSFNGDRAVAVELNGKVTEIGTVAHPGFDPLRACFATASLVTGQYFLARIDAKLNAILNDVHEIVWMLDSAERARLNVATSYLQFLITAVRQGRCFEQDEADIRTHRAECLLVAERNLIVLEDEMGVPESREALGATERLGKLSSRAANWVGDKASVLRPSARGDDLMKETKDFAKGMTRGLLALQTSLCFEAILEPPEAHSPAGMHLLSVKERFGSVREKFETQFHEKKKTALEDWRYFEAEEKRERFERELNSLVASVNRHWEAFEELETQWKRRAASVPQVVYVEVNEVGQPQQFFLPEG